MITHAASVSLVILVLFPFSSAQAQSPDEILRFKLKEDCTIEFSQRRNVAESPSDAPEYGYKKMKIYRAKKLLKTLSAGKSKRDYFDYETTKDLGISPDQLFFGYFKHWDGGTKEGDEVYFISAKSCDEIDFVQKSNCLSVDAFDNKWQSGSDHSLKLLRSKSENDFGIPRSENQNCRKD